MFATPDSRKQRRDWALLGVCAGVVLATVPLARALTGALEDRFGGRVFLALTLVGLFASGAFALRTLRGAPRRASLSVLATGLALGGYAILLQDNAIETLHLLEYAAISIFAFRALSHRTRDLTLHGSAILLCALLGALDEATQWLIPGRVWDLRDMGFDTLAAAIAQLPIAFGIRPDWIERRGTRSGWHRLCAIGLVATLFLGGCFAATPPRLAWLATHVPGLAFLQGHPDVMLEYGELITLPNGTRFRSRSTLSELIAHDHREAANAGALLERWHDDDRYGEFLRTFTPIGAPFLHELRVHLFRRDRYLETAERHRDVRPLRYRHDRAVGLREQEILEAAFGNTMRLAHWDLEPPLRAALETESHPVDGYLSRVSESLITRWSEATVLAIPGVSALLFLSAWASTRPRGQP